MHANLKGIIALGAIIASSTSSCFASNGCASDIDNDHLTSVSDLLAVIDNWGACPAAPLPCNSDVVLGGGVDVNDLLAVINNWGSCPCLPQFGCISANSVWCEDFELNNYSRWTGGYSATGPCRTSNFTSENMVSVGHSNRSQVFCVNTADSHRGYGGLRFQGDSVLSSFSTPSTGGINAPNGVIASFWMWLDVPYDFSPTKWLSLATVTHDCSNNWDQVVTINLDDSSRRLKPVHVTSVTYASGAPAVPLRQWTHVTWYINYNTGQIHLWQNGQKVASATFSRPITTMCQWHWGLYASGNNDDILLYEDDIRIMKLQQPMTNFTAEPWIPAGMIGCP